MFVQNLNGDIACDLRFGKCMEVYLSKKGDCSRFRILGGVFIQKLKGDTACDFKFGELICKKLTGDIACD